MRRVVHGLSLSSLLSFNLLSGNPSTPGELPKLTRNFEKARVKHRVVKKVPVGLRLIVQSMMEYRLAESVLRRALYFGTLQFRN